ncbi:Peptide transporter PTR1 [Hordeum vulgare]|nr:Peptide transporter PTR1 [Hordeum vulgare]
MASAWRRPKTTTDEVASGEPVRNYRGWKGAMPYVIGNETFEKLGTLGTLWNLLVYLMTVYHIKSVTTATLLNFFSGTSNLATILDAFISDTYLGRHTTLAVATIASFIDMILLTLTAALHSLHPPTCASKGQCEGPTPSQLAALLVSFFFLVIGVGGIRPCNLTFGADQFDAHTTDDRRGSGGAIFAQVLIAASRKRRVRLAHNTFELFDPPHQSKIVSKLAYTDQFTCLDKAVMRTPEDVLCYDQKTPVKPWRLCMVQQVEEVKCVARIIPVWSSGIVYFMVLAQLGTDVVFQAAKTDRGITKSSSFQIPQGSFIIFQMLALTLWIPMYDRVMVPTLFRLTKCEGGINLLQRIGIGLVLSVVTMLLSAAVEHRGSRTAMMSCFWLVPQQLLAGL